MKLGLNVKITQVCNTQVSTKISKYKDKLNKLNKLKIKKIRNR